MHRRPFLSVVTGTVGVAIAGCAGASTEDGGDPAAQTSERPTATPTQAPTNTPTETPFPAHERYSIYAWERLEDAEPAEASEITMRNTEFHPLIAKVTTGELPFINEDLSRHTIAIPGLEIDEISVGGDERVSLSIDETGVFDYVCTLHAPDMLGRLIVE